MPTIKIEVKNNIALNLTPEIEIVSNNGDYNIEFSFDSLWDSSSVKTARFYYNFCHTDIVFDGNICKVPPLEETKLLKVGVFTDTNKTTTDAEIQCRFSIKKYGGNVHEPAKDVYGQIIDLLNKYIEQGGGGGISREEVERIINEYLTENPPKDGVDGFSPTITTTAIENGTRVEITDINGTKSFDVLNGKDGTQIDLSNYYTKEETDKKIDEKLNGIELPEPEIVIKGENAPTTETVGKLGSFYFDTIKNNTYQCVAVNTETPSYTWVKMIIETDLVDFDDRNAKKGGLVLPYAVGQQDDGGIIVSSLTKGQLLIERALDADIDNRTVNNYIDGAVRDSNRTHPVCPANLDYAVFAVLTNPKLTLTEEQKATIRANLGI